MSELESTATADTSWWAREQERFDSGFYKKLPEIGLSYPYSHFIHLSRTKEQTDFIAYTPSNEYGVRDRQVRMKFGKYLKKTFEWMSDDYIREYVTRFKAKLELQDRPTTLHFATDKATINEIFETCMNAENSSSSSCMYGKFDGPRRPYHAYANSPDVAVAYLRNDADEIIARSVVSTKNKRWVRCYAVGGDPTLCEMLRDALAKEGYERSGCLEGNRLTKVDGDEPVLPYLDGGCQNVRDDGDYWVVDSDGEYTADNTDGTASGGGDRCEDCDRHVDDCSCYYCDCCEERRPGGCEDCSNCELCDNCHEHGGCDCSRCTDCHELINEGGPRYTWVSTCHCDRCESCNELESECDCEKCGECNEIFDNCSCAAEVTEQPAETETACAQN